MSERIVPITTPELRDSPRLNWLFLCLDGHMNPEKRRIIEEACKPGVEFISSVEAAALIVALGLE